MTRTRWYLTTTAVLALTAGLYASALAQSGGTYDPWRNPDVSSSHSNTASSRKYDPYDKDVGSLIRDLEELIRIGRRDRAADPRFLDDMEDRLENYKKSASGSGSGSGFGSTSGSDSSSSSSVVIFSDNFKTGNQANAPDWQVVRTGWYIDNAEGLRSNVLPGRATSGASDDRNLIDDLFSSKKKRKKKKKKREEARKRAQPLEADIAELRLEKRIPNNFTLDMTFKDLAGTGTLSAFLYQQGSRDIGYRLEMRDGGAATVVRLYRVGSSGPTLLAERNMPSSRSGGRVPAHKVTWVRAKSRRIGVTVDGQELFTITDRSFRDDWDGFALINSHGEFAVRHVRVRG